MVDEEIFSQGSSSLRLRNISRHEVQGVVARQGQSSLGVRTCGSGAFTGGRVRVTCSMSGPHMAGAVPNFPLTLLWLCELGGD